MSLSIQIDKKKVGIRLRKIRKKNFFFKNKIKRNISILKCVYMFFNMNTTVNFL